jgi:C-terminal processing protease CtpA/Prc
MKPFTLKRKITGALFSALVLLCSITCSPTLAQQATPQASPVPQQAGLSQAGLPNEKADAQKRLESFELVWKTVNQRFYDPTFGGVDWNKVRERYAPLVARVNNDQELHLLLQQMLNELHQSHFVIIPKESIPKFIPKHRSSNADSNETDVEDDSFETDKESASPLDRIGYKLTERLSTGIGIDLRIMSGSAVITRVQPGSAAARRSAPWFSDQAGGRQFP